MATTRTTVIATDDTLNLYQTRDLESPVIATVANGAKIQLGAIEEFGDREWMEATLENETVGYVLAPSARSHTTLGSRLPPRSSPPSLKGRTAPNQTAKGANAVLWTCSMCGSPPSEKIESSRHFLAGEVCNKCGCVLCENCFKKRNDWNCQCGGLFVSAPFDLRKKPLSQTSVDARAKGETPESAKTALGCLLIVFLVGLAVLAVVGIGQSGLTVTRVLKYAIITIGIIVATVGVKKKNGLLFLGAAIIAAGQLFFK